jgi:hypothetical protein
MPAYFAKPCMKFTFRVFSEERSHSRQRNSGSGEHCSQPWHIFSSKEVGAHLRKRQSRGRLSRGKISSSTGGVCSGRKNRSALVVRRAIPAARRVSREYWWRGERNCVFAPRSHSYRKSAEVGFADHARTSDLSGIPPAKSRCVGAPGGKTTSLLADDPIPNWQ